MHVLLLYNQPVLPADHPDGAAEAGVLEAVDAVSHALTAGGHLVRRLAVGSSATQFFAQLLGAQRPDVVFNLCEGLGGTGSGEFQVAGAIELIGWPMTGSSAECLALARDKCRTKWLLAGCGLPTPEFVLIETPAALPEMRLAKLLEHGPVIVKPAREDASLGIGPHSVVSELAELQNRIEDVGAAYGPVLVERYIAGREFNAAVIALPEAQLLPLSEIEFDSAIPPGRRVVTYEAKWSSGSAADRATAARCPAKVEPALAKRIGEVAMAAFAATGCGDYARIDLRVDESGQPYILEVNGNPDIAPGAGFARCLKAGGWEYERFVNRLAEHAALRGPCISLVHESSRNSAAPPRVSRGPAEVQLRPLCETDVPQLVEMLRACGVFRPAEVTVGEEVLREAAANGAAGHYQVIVAEKSGVPIGWSCHGLVPLTDATYDLYWIAVDPQHQSLGAGRRLLDEIENRLRAASARWLLAETSASEVYIPTRRFYERTGFEMLSDIHDFYACGDGRLIFGKRLNEVDRQ